MSLNFSCSASLLPKHHQVSSRNDISLRNVQNLIQTVGLPLTKTSPPESLKKGNWVKLICGASFEDVVDIRNLSLVYTLAGVDCIDCAAEDSVVSAVNEGIEAARGILAVERPWVMISVNDHDDLHFRKAEFDPEDCPPDCSRPCENVCPANAISLQIRSSNPAYAYSSEETAFLMGGVITERCYGCGRCFPVCPYDKIREVTYVRDATATSELLKRTDIDAIEIHTSGRQTNFFEQLWNGLGDSINNLKLVAVSLPDLGDSTISSMWGMYSIMEPHLQCYNLWQLDGRPMSGDIGRGATREAIAFAVHLAATEDRPPGFLQLAGGTNAHTVTGLKNKGLLQTTACQNSTDKAFPSDSPRLSHASISGVAYGGYARKIVGRVLRTMQTRSGPAHIEDYPEHLKRALEEALALVRPVKCYDPCLD